MFKSASDCRLLIGAILTKPTKCSCTANLHSIKLSFKSLFRITTFIYKCIYFDNQKLELTPEKNLLGNIQEIISFYYLFMSISSKLFSPINCYHILSCLYITLLPIFSFFLFTFIWGISPMQAPLLSKLVFWHLVSEIQHVFRSHSSLPASFYWSTTDMIPGGVWTFDLVASRMIRCPHTSLQ